MAYPVLEYSGKNIYTDNAKAFEFVYGLQKKLKNKGDKPEVIDSLFVSLKSYLILGRILGIIPISGIFKSTHQHLIFRILSFTAIISLTVTTIVGFSAMMAFVQTVKLSKSNALEIARSVQGTAFLMWGLFGYVYFLLQANSFIKIFHVWSNSSLHFSTMDKTLNRDCIIIPVVIFLSMTFETTINHLAYFPQFDHINGMAQHPNASLFLYPSALETFYWRSSAHWGNYLGYHPLLAVWSFVAHKFVLAAWNYVDVLMILMSRTLYFKFKALCEVAQDNLHTSNQNSHFKITHIAISEKLTWIHIVKDHDTLCGILEAYENFLSPLIFGSYSLNIYYICMQLIDGLTPEKAGRNLVDAIFTPWSFLHLIMRICLLSLTAAKINTYAHEIGNILKKCPIEMYDVEVARVDKHVTSGPDIGLTGLGCFVVTKPFILSMINVIFTVEIVLLQGLSSTTSGTCPSTS